MLRRFEELQTLLLVLRLARQVQRLARRFGRPIARGVSIELGATQGEAAHASVAEGRVVLNVAGAAAESAL